MEKHNLLLEAEDLKEYLINCRRKLHSVAETGFELPKTLDFVAGELRTMGIEPKHCGRAGLTALIGSGEGECFLLRADMDALPVPEESGLPFASTNGNSHACGHDVHTAMLLGAAKLLKVHEKELKGQVKLMFQPAEETLEGAKDMIEAGVLGNPTPRGALMLHLMTASSLPCGSVVIPKGDMGAPAADYFSIEVRGKGCHGASPNTGIDPITAAAHILIALQELSARELGMNEDAVLTIGAFRGGEASNVIPDSVIMEGTLRAMEDETREYIKLRLVEIAKGIAASFRTEAKVSFGSGCPGFLMDGELLKNLDVYARELLGEKMVFNAAHMATSGGRDGRTAGSEDFAYVSRKVPSVMLALAAGESEKGYVHPLHHPAVRFDEEAMPSGAALMAHIALRRLEEK